MTFATRITIARILLIAPFIILMLNAHDEQYGNLYRYAALVTFVIMALGDGLDGYLARRRNQVTRLGSFLDPMGDKLLTVSALILLSVEATHINGFRLPVWIVVVMIGKEVITLAGFLLIYFMTLQIRIVPVYIGKFATALQFFMISGILIGPEFSSIWPGWSLFIRIIWWSTAVIAILATLIYIRNGMRYIEEFDQQSAKRTAGKQ